MSPKDRRRKWKQSKEEHRIVGRSTQVLDDLKNTKYWKLEKVRSDSLSDKHKENGSQFRLYQMQNVA